MLSLEEGRKATNFARYVVDSFVKKEKIKSFDFEEVFNQEFGVFVTIHTYPKHDLRGCIGIPQPVMSLKKAINEAGKSVTKDPRFPPLTESELDKIIIEITVLTKPEIIEVKQPKDYPNNIKVGRDGLIVEQGPYSGLLLPQVPIEQDWDEKEFLSNTCIKAWLLPDAWLDESTKIYKFRGQIFTEIKPEGKIKEKNLDGSDS